MAQATRSITLVLTNTQAVPQVWSLFGNNLGLPLVREEATISNAGTENSSPDVFLYNGPEPEGKATFINNVSDSQAVNASAEAEKETILSSVQEATANPIKVNKIRIYTDNTDQLLEQFVYYRQNPTGLYEKQILNVIRHFNPELPRTWLEIGKQYIGEMTLDGNRRLEVKVLANTILLVELLYEADDPLAQLGVESPFPTPSFSFGNESFSEEDDEPEGDKKAGQKKVEELERPDPAQVRAFVRAFFVPAKKSEALHQVPVLFALAQSALETGYGLLKPGYNMFGTLAGKNWKGLTQFITTHECTQTTEKLVQKIEAPNKECGNRTAYQVKALFRAYTSPLESFSDQAKTFRTNRYQMAFASTTDAFGFAQKIVQARYATSPRYESRLLQTMQLIKPYVDEMEREHNARQKALKAQKIALLTLSAVVISVVVWNLLKGKFLLKAI